MTLLSHGEDPYFLLPELKRDEEMQYIMKIDLNTPQPTTWQIFYGTLKRPQYNEEHSISGQLQAGENTFYVVLDDKNHKGESGLIQGQLWGNIF